MKKCKSVLNVIGWLFYGIAIGSFLYASAQVMLDNLYFAEFMYFAGGALFTASWGALLHGIGSLAQKEE